MNLQGIEKLGRALGRTLPRRLAVLRIGTAGVAAGALSGIGVSPQVRAAQLQRCSSRFRMFEASGVETILEGRMLIQFDPSGTRTEGTLIIDFSGLSLLTLDAGQEVIVFCQYFELGIGLLVDVFQDELPNTFGASGTADPTLSDCFGHASGGFAVTTESDGVTSGVWRLDVEGPE